MGKCNKEHLKIQSIMKELPTEQRGVGRHKCAACAYEKGFEDGKRRVMSINIDEILSNLEESQAGEQRHKSAHVAYIKGYLDGLLSVTFDGKEETVKTNIDYIAPDTIVSKLQETVNIDLDPSEESLLKKSLLIDLAKKDTTFFPGFDTTKFSVSTYRKLRSFGLKTLYDVLNIELSPDNQERFIEREFTEYSYLKDYLFGLVNKRQEQEEKVEGNDCKVEELKLSLGEQKYSLLLDAYAAFYDKLDDVIKNKLGSTSPEDFINNYLFSKDSDFLNIHYVGKKYAFPLIEFKNKVYGYLKDLESALPDNLVDFEWPIYYSYFGKILDGSFLINDSRNENYSYKEYFKDNGHLPVLRLLENLLELYSPISGYISCFISKYSTFKSKYNCLKQELTPYWMSQKADIVKNILRCEREKLQSVAELKDFIDLYDYLRKQKLTNYLFEELKSLDVITYSKIEELLQKERCEKLDIWLVMLFFSTIWPEIFASLDIQTQNINNCSFLVKRDLADKYDFSHACNFFKNEIETQRFENSVFNIKEIVKDKIDFWLDLVEFPLIDRIKNVLIIILIDGFHANVIGDELTLFKNSKKSERDIIYEALESLNAPSTPERILKYINEKFEDSNINLDIVKYSLGRDDRIIFTRYERKYALASWNCLIGSYRDFAREILEASEVPLTIEQIYENLPEERKSDLRSLASNIAQWDDTVLFIGNLWGLKGKNYPPNYILDMSGKLGFLDKCAKLLNFVRENHRLPLPTDSPEIKQLYHWWSKLPYRQLTLSNEESKALNEIKETIANMKETNSIDVGFINSFNSYKDFVLANHRLPVSRNSVSESRMDKWYKETQSRFMNGQLDEKELKLYIETMKLRSKL